MSNLIYEDKFKMSSRSYTQNFTRDLIRGMQMWPVIILFMVSVILFVRYVRDERVYPLLIIAFVAAAIFVQLGTLVTKHQIFNDKIRIVLSWFFHFDIPFGNIDKISEATVNALWGLHLNLIPLVTGDDVVQITRKHGWKVNIMPADRKLFLENLNKAMNEFKGHYVSF